MDNKTFDEQYERAKEAAKAADLTEPRARHAHYDFESARVVVYLTTGSGKSFSFLPSEIKELAQASSEELGRIEVSPSGDGLYWPALDVDLGVEYLLNNFADSDVASVYDDNASEDLLNQLFAQIEIAWIQNRDAHLVDQLAERHPEYKDELFDFLKLLIDGELGEPYSQEEIVRSVGQTKKWLTEEGYALAAKIAKEAKPHSMIVESQENPESDITETTPSSHNSEPKDEEKMQLGFMGLLQLRTRLPPYQLQEELGVPDFILTFVQDNPPEETPSGAREEIVGLAVKKGWIEKEKGEEALNRVLRKAAFRQTPYPHYKPGGAESTAGLRFKRYIELISNSRLKKLEKRRWLAFAKEEGNG
jgi:Protein of unknown function (DUF2442)